MMAKSVRMKGPPGYEKHQVTNEDEKQSRALLAHLNTKPKIRLQRIKHGARVGREPAACMVVAAYIDENELCGIVTSSAKSE